MTQGKSGKDFDYEVPGGTIKKDLDKTLQALLLELLTVQYTLPYSGDGTGIIMRIDDRSVNSAPRNKNDVARTIRNNYSDTLKLKSVKQIIDVNSSYEKMKITVKDLSTGNNEELTI